MKSERGITWIALIITIIVLILLTGAGISAGGKSLNDTKLKAFYTKLEIAQEGVTKIINTNEKYKDDEGNEVEVKNLGTEPTQGQKDFIESTIGVASTGFRYFTANQVEKDLQIYGVNMNLLINFDTNTIVNPEGIRIGRKYYYMLENKRYTVNKDTDKNTGTPSFDYNAYHYGQKSYLIEIIPTNVGDINQGIVRYRKIGQDYWEIANENKFILDALGKVEVNYVDANDNSTTKILRIWLEPWDPEGVWIEEV